MARSPDADVRFEYPEEGESDGSRLAPVLAPVWVTGVAAPLLAAFVYPLAVVSVAVVALLAGGPFLARSTGASADDPRPAPTQGWATRRQKKRGGQTTPTVSWRR